MTFPEGFGEIVEKLRRSTVVVASSGRGGGSGFVTDEGGIVVTNAHVVSTRVVQVQLWDGEMREARVLARGGDVDLALLKIPPGGLAPVHLAESAELRKGDFVIAVGNPFGFIGAVTTGTVRSVGPVRGLGEDFYVHAAIRLAPGNSGGPLSNARGEVVGVNSMVVGNTALSIPASRVREFMNRARMEATLGVLGRRVPLSLNGSPHIGLVIMEIQRESSAEAAALLPGDIIIGVNDRLFLNVTDVDEAFRSEGERMMRLQFVRGDRTHIRSVTLVLHPRRNQAA